MKTTMKLFTYALLICSLVFASCSKDGEIGPIGPAGAQGIAGADGIDGADGANGADGTNGTDGNANVQLLEFGAKTFTGSTSYQMNGISLSDINNNLFIAFYGRVFNQMNGNGGIIEKTQWIPVPGKGHNDLFESSAVIEGSSTSFNSEYKVSLYHLDGTEYTTAVSFREFKIFMVPPTSTTGKSSASQLSKMPYNDLITHFELEE